MLGADVHARGTAHRARLRRTYEMLYMQQRSCLRCGPAHYHNPGTMSRCRHHVMTHLARRLVMLRLPHSLSRRPEGALQLLGMPPRLPDWQGW